MDDEVGSLGGGGGPAQRPGDHGRRPGIPALAVIALVVVVGGLVAVTIWSGDGRWFALDVAVGVVAWAGSPVLLSRPVAGALGLSVLAAISPAATPPASLGALQVAWRRRFPVALAVAACGVAAHAVQGVWRTSGGLSFVRWLAVIALAYGALMGWGAWARARQALICSLRERARRAEAEQGRRVAEAQILERTRIAREMHDVLAHRLSLVATYAGALEYRPDLAPQQLAQAAGVVRAGVHQALDELRDILVVLRAGEPTDELEGRPQPVLADLARLIDESRDAGTEVLFRDDVQEPNALPSAVVRTAYRVVQEGLTNARRHAAGCPVRVALHGRPGVGLEIDIRNFLSSGPQAGSIPGTGLVGLTERLHLAGGRLDHGRAGDEFRLHAWIPWPA